MQNVTQRIEGNKLILEIDLTQEIGLSETGKTINVANSGFATLKDPDYFSYGFKLNVWKRLVK